MTLPLIVSPLGGRMVFERVLIDRHQQDEG